MLKQKIPDFLIISLTLIVIILSSYLWIGVNRMIVRAEEMGNAAERFEKVAPTGLGPAEAQADTGLLTYQEPFTNPNASISQQQGGLQEGQGYGPVGPSQGSMGGITSQSTNSRTEFVPASAFRHDGESPASGYRFSSVSGGYIRNNSASQMCIAAPVYLPHNTTFRRFTMFFVDKDPGLEMETAQLWRKRLESPPGTAAELITDLSFLGNEITNDIFIYEAFNENVPAVGLRNISNSYGYYITFCFAPNTDFNHRIYGFSVDYDFP